MFTHTADYDNAIAGYLTPWRDTLPARVTLSMERRQVLRYGENPQQRAGLYVTEEPRGIGDLTQRQGKELSFNNLLDIDAAMMAVAAWTSRVACAVIKHTTPCGLALGHSAAEAFERARASDPVSAFGSVIAFNTVVDRPAADAMADLFIEVVVAPAFHADALARFAEKKNLRVVELPVVRGQAGLDWKKIRGGFLIQDQFTFNANEDAWRTVTKREPTAARAERSAFCLGGRDHGQVECHRARARRADDRDRRRADEPHRRLLPGRAQGPPVGAPHRREPRWRPTASFRSRMAWKKWPVPASGPSSSRVDRCAMPK